MFYAIIQTIQLLGRRVLLRLSGLAGVYMFSGLIQIIPLLFILPIMRVIARPSKQFEGLPKRMKRLFPEDWANYLDQLIATTETKTLIISVALIALVLFGIQSIITRYAEKRMMRFLDQQRDILANRLFNNYLEADIFSYDNPMDKIKSGCSALMNLLRQVINSSFSIIMFFLIASILIFIYPLPSFTSMLIIITTTFLLVFVIQPKRQYVLARDKVALQKDDLLLQDSMTAIKEIKLMGREQFFFRSYMKSLTAQQAQQQQQDKFKTISSIITVVCKYTGLIVGLIIALYTLPKEDFSGFVMIFIMLTMRATGYVQKIAISVNGVYNSLMILRLRYKTMLRHDEKSTNFEDTPIVCKESIEFKDICFRYKNEKDEEEDDESILLMQQEQDDEEETVLPYVLEDVTLRIKRGQYIGLVGKNGSGKSTILDLFAGLVSPTQGSILIDGKKLETLARKNWRRQINYVVQKPHIISQNIIDNITLGLEEEEIDEKLLENALELSMLNEVIRQLPKGLETMVGRRGTKISGGQAQRIVLARALYQDRPILLLDEATRAVDAATEAEIMERISAIRGTKTVIMVTHRVQSLRQCDKIYVVDNKKIIAEGDYDTLCKTSELFKLFALGKRETKHKKIEKEIPSVA